MDALEIVRMHDDFRKRTLNMQASENYLSQEVRTALASDMASRYSMVFDMEVHGAMVHNAYGGTKHQERIVEYAKTLAGEVFGFENTCVKPISGHAAAMAVLISLTKRGDKIMAISPYEGGYDGYSSGYLPEILGLHYRALKLKDMREVEVEEIMDYKPNLVILGASYIPFPYNLKDVLDVAEDSGARVVYDASHVMGLLPAGFQRDLERCHMIYGSTHKSYPGPQGGIVMSNSSLDTVEKNLTWKVQDNYHTNRVAALAVSLEKFRPVAKIYGKKVRENSRTLAKTLHKGGLRIKFPPEFTESHQILVDTEFMNPVHFGETMERNGIIVDRVGRIGTAELTWKGYTPEHMEKIGKIMLRALSGESVQNEVETIVEQWNGKTLGKV